MTNDEIKAFGDELIDAGKFDDKILGDARITHLWNCIRDSDEEARELMRDPLTRIEIDQIGVIRIFHKETGAIVATYQAPAAAASEPPPDPATARQHLLESLEAARAAAMRLAYAEQETATETAWGKMIAEAIVVIARQLLQDDGPVDPRGTGPSTESEPNHEDHDHPR